MVSDPDVRIEISFELHHELKTLPGTYITYLGMWRHRRCVFEFCLGALQERPDVASYGAFAMPLIECLKGYNPDDVSIMSQLRRS